MHEGAGAAGGSLVPFSVPRAWPASTVVCVATGPSLTPEDVDACRGRARVIVVNDAYRLASWADVLYACDARWWRWHEGAPAFGGLKVGLAVPGFRYPPDVQLMQPTGDEGVETQPTGLRTGHHSGYQAVNLAVHFGARRIVLLGYDLRFGPGGAHHFFGAHPNGVAPALDRFLPPYTTLVAPLAQLGVEILNATRCTALTVVPRVPLEEALA